MNFADFTEIVMDIDQSGADTSSSEVILKDLATGDTIDIQAVSMDGDNNLVIEFDYEGTSGG